MPPPPPPFPTRDDTFTLELQLFSVVSMLQQERAISHDGCLSGMGLRCVLIGWRCWLVWIASPRHGKQPTRTASAGNGTMFWLNSMSWLQLWLHDWNARGLLAFLGINQKKSRYSQTCVRTWSMSCHVTHQRVKVCECGGGDCEGVWACGRVGVWVCGCSIIQSVDLMVQYLKYDRIPYVIQMYSVCLQVMPS